MAEVSSSTDALQLISGHRTDRGRVRSRNEDAVAFHVPSSAEEARGSAAFFAVADGLGGHDSGDLASRSAIDTVQQSFVGLWGRLGEPPPDIDLWLADVFHRVNRELRELGRRKGALRGIGTTLTLAVVRAGRLHIGHIGDSRCYLHREGRLSQLTRDHSWSRNVLTQCLGVDEEIEIFLADEEIRSDDRVLLCTDGLHDLLDEEAMAAVLIEEPDPDTAARRLVDLGNERGGPDNLTALVFDARSRKDPPLPA